jgi:hypothetical protein
MRMLCRVLGHRPRYWPGVRVGVYTYGPGFRQCDRCLDILEGTDPRVGDRLKP